MSWEQLQPIITLYFILGEYWSWLDKRWIAPSEKKQGYLGVVVLLDSGLFLQKNWWNNGQKLADGQVMKPHFTGAADMETHIVIFWACSSLFLLQEFCCVPSPTLFVAGGHKSHLIAMESSEMVCYEFVYINSKLFSRKPQILVKYFL